MRNGANDGSNNSARQRRVYFHEVPLHIRLAAAAERDGAKGVSVMNHMCVTKRYSIDRFEQSRALTQIIHRLAHFRRLDKDAKIKVCKSHFKRWNQPGGIRFQEMQME